MDAWGIYLSMREWAYEVYDTIGHPALGQSPRDAFARGMVTAGERAHRLIPYDDEFRRWTLPTNRKGTAKVWPGRGVKINNFYYWSEGFRRPDVEGTRVSVRYDPFDVSLGFAYVRGEWAECHSEHQLFFRGRSEREIMLATAELRRRNARHSQQFNITAARIAHFLESVEAEEALFRQRATDREAHNVLTLINNEPVTSRPNQDSPAMPATAISHSDVQPLRGQSLGGSHTAEEFEVYGEF